VSAVERVRAIPTYDNASDLEAVKGMLAVVLSHVADFPGAGMAIPRHAWASIAERQFCTAGIFVRRIGGDTHNFIVAVVRVSDGILGRGV
jgi:hypothetical protein